MPDRTFERTCTNCGKPRSMRISHVCRHDDVEARKAWERAREVNAPHERLAHKMDELLGELAEHAADIMRRLEVPTQVRVGFVADLTGLVATWKRGIHAGGYAMSEAAEEKE